MIVYKNLYIIGTSHISIDSINEVKNFIIKDKPDIIALELDKARFLSLTSEEKNKINLYSIKKIGLKGFIFSLIGSWAQRRLGNLVGVAPGSEMLTAISLAKELKIPIVFIDQDINITLKRISYFVTFKEKIRFFTDILKGFIFKKINGLNIANFDLKKVPEEKLITIILRFIKKRYPGFYKALIHERNIIIAKNLNRIIEANNNKKILAVLGAGHLPGLMEILKSG